MKYLLLDVAGTILYKPDLFNRIQEALNEHGHFIDIEKLKINHKLLSEALKFPDRTDSSFYAFFNSELLYSLGIVPNLELLDNIFKKCSYLPWQKFEDTVVLNDIEIPKGIISNFNSSLKEKLDGYFGPIFSDIFVSEELGISKPSAKFYQYVLKKIGAQPNEVLYIGDSFKLDLKPAIELGINAYIIDRDGYYPGNAHTITSLTDIIDLI